MNSGPSSAGSSTAPRPSDGADARRRRRSPASARPRSSRGACCRPGPGVVDGAVGTCLPLASMSIPFLPIRSALRGAGRGRRGDRHRGRRTTDRDVRRSHSTTGSTRRCAERARRADHRRRAVGRPLDARRAHVRDRGTRVSVGSPSITTLRCGRGRAGASAAALAGGRPAPPAHGRARARAARSSRRRPTQIGTACSERSPHQSLVDDVHRRSRGNPYFTRLMVAGPLRRRRARRRRRSRPTSARRCCSRGSACRRRRDGSPRVLAVGGRRDARRRARARSWAIRTRVDPDRGCMEAVDSGTLEAARRRRVLVPPPVERRGARAAASARTSAASWHRRFADLTRRRSASARRPIARVAAAAVAIADHRVRRGARPRAAFECGPASPRTSPASIGRARRAAATAPSCRRACAASCPTRTESLDDAAPPPVRTVAADAGSHGR